MHKDEFKTPLSTEVALDRISQNHSSGCKWYPVKTKCGNIVELGGRSDGFLKVYVARLDKKGDVITHLLNDFSQHTFSMEVDKEGYGLLDLPDYHTPYNIDREGLIKMIDTHKKLNYKRVDREPIYKMVETITGYNISFKQE